MQLDHRFAVPLPPEQAWSALLDLDLVAGCFPGAQLESVDGDTFEGRVRVKLGPVSFTYRGQGRFVERDDDGRRVVIEARGRDIRGASTAGAVVTATVSPDGDGSDVHVVTELDVTGPPAQLGGGMLQDVSNRLLDQFVARLRDQVSGQPADGPAAGAGAAAAGAGGVTGAAGGRPAEGEADDDQLDLVAAVLGSQRALLLAVGAAALGGLIAGAVLGRLCGRRPVHVRVVYPQA